VKRVCDRKGGEHSFVFRLVGFGSNLLPMDNFSSGLTGQVGRMEERALIL
jgi:hypothetical protein